MAATNTRSGLSLVELVVVLTILVVLAGVAVTATQGAVEDARYQATRATLANVEDALLGRWASPTGAPNDRAAGFVSDVGRLPELVSSADGEQLAELWVLPMGAREFAMQVPAGDAQARVLCGWRGPYVRLPLAATSALDARELKDGWARDLVVRRADDVVALAGDEIAQIGTLGADGIAGGATYDEDLTLVVHRTAAPLVAPRHRGALPLRVTPSASTGAERYLVVRVYGPRDGVADTLAQEVVDLGATPSSAVQDVLFPDVTIGPRLVRAYQADTNPATPQSDLSSAVRKSALVHVEIVPGGVQPLEIVVP